MEYGLPVGSRIPHWHFPANFTPGRARKNQTWTFPRLHFGLPFALWSAVWSKMALFECCSKQFVKDTGRSTLHPIVDLNSSPRCNILCVVVKKKSRWFWKSVKYQPTPFTLNEILTQVSCLFLFPYDRDLLECSICKRNGITRRNFSVACIKIWEESWLFGINSQ